MIKPTIREYVDLKKQLEELKGEQKKIVVQISMSQDKLKDMSKSFNDVFYILVDGLLVFRSDRTQLIRVIKPGQG